MPSRPGLAACSTTKWGMVVNGRRGSHEICNPVIFRQHCIRAASAKGLGRLTDTTSIQPQLNIESDTSLSITRWLWDVDTLSGLHCGTGHLPASFLDDKVGGRDTERKPMMSPLSYLVVSTPTQASRAHSTMFEESGEGGVHNRFLRPAASTHTSQPAICM
jgi:hypothetical protein